MSEFGAYYCESLALKVFGADATLTDGDGILDAAWPIAVADLGMKEARWKFCYDEDFPGDVISAYNYVKSGS